MTFIEYLKQKVQDEVWLWSVISELNPNYPRIAKTMVVIRAHSQWVKER